MSTAAATFLPAEIWQNVFDLLGSGDRLSDMTHAWTTLRLVNSTFKRDVEARFKQLFNKGQIRIRITGGIYCATWDTFSEAKARAYDDYIARRHHCSYERLYASKYSAVVDKTDMHFGSFQEHDEEHVLFHNLRTESSDKDDSLHVSLGFRRLMELRAGSEESCTGALPADPADYFSLTALQHFTRRQWKGPQLQRLYPTTEEVDPFLKSPIQVKVGSWKTNCPISDIGFDFKNRTLQFSWREILASFFGNMRLANALHNDNATLRARAWQEVRHRRERTHLAGSRFPGYPVAWDGNLESLISQWDSCGPSEEPMLLALGDSKYGQKLRQHVLTVPRRIKYPNPLDSEEKEPKWAEACCEDKLGSSLEQYPYPIYKDQETKAQQVEFASDEPGLVSTYKYKSGKSANPTLPSVSAAASSKAQSAAVRESTATLKRKRTPTKVATEDELFGDLEHDDDASPLSAKRRFLGCNTTYGGVASREYSGGSGLVAKVNATESQRNILNNQPTGTSNTSAPSNSMAGVTVKHNKVHSKYWNAPATFLNSFETLPRKSSHTTPRRPYLEAHRKSGSSIGFVPQKIEPLITSTPKGSHPLTPELSGEFKDRISAIFNTPLSAPAKLGWTKTSRIDGGLRGEAPQGLEASGRSQGTGSRVATTSGSALPVTPGLTPPKKRAFDDGPGEEISQGCIQSPLPAPRINAKHPGGFDLKSLEGIRRRAEAPPPPAARPSIKRKRARM